MTNTALNDRFLRLPEVMDTVGLRRTAVYAKINAGDFPSPIKLGNVSVWLGSEISGWIADRVAEYREAG